MIILDKLGLTRTVPYHFLYEQHNTRGSDVAASMFGAWAITSVSFTLLAHPALGKVFVS
jgi:hypothetical protein